MRPRLLRLRGFTSFRDDQQLDFSDLGIFAITGPTGAGKSSLLDAITYALYGRIERVSNECSQLISHGLNRMSVTLDFDVNGKQYRVTRATPAKGATKVSLERLEDGEARSYGEGADRVRECDRMIAELLGLDYTGFTRSVLLPQGKFAEFMVGDPAKRREILSDLLGHGLFQRMTKTAGQRASECGSGASSRRGVLHSEYAEVSAEALEAARQTAEAAQGRLDRLDSAAKDVNELVERWRAEQSRAAELKSCAVDLHDWVRRLDAVLESLDKLAVELEQHEDRLTDAAAAADEAERAAVLAREERESAEASWGTLVELAGAHTTACRLPGLRQQVGTLERQLAETAACRPRLESELETHRAALATGTEAVSEAESTLSAAEQRKEHLEHADKAAALAEGMSVGDPCPVCAQPLERLPEHPGTAAIAMARQAARAAHQGLEQSRDAVRQIARKIENTERDIQETAKEHQRRSEQLGAIQHEFDEADGLVRTALRGLETEDLPSALQQRIEQLNGFARREQTAVQHREDAARKLQEVVNAGELLVERLGQQRLALEEPGLLLVNRAAGLEVFIRLPETPAPDANLGDLVVFGRAKATAIASTASTLETRAQQAADAETALLGKALASTSDLVEPATTLVALADYVSAAHTEAARTQAIASQLAESLAIRLEHRQTLEAEIKQLDEQAALYQQLATDLRGDRLIWFLQDEALKLLAAAGSEHLLGLCEGRYRLRYDREFFVVDTWNGDEERSVKTLSGGETFLASLALALALSEQVRTLAVSERARLDSLFLDEGFGTLDPDTLSVVTEAIERLGGDGRMVGVITHVRELAENFERIEVEKSPRGSRLRRVSG